MSDTILYLQRAVAHILTWAAAPTAMQTRGRPQDFVAGTRVPRSGLPRVFVRTLACISMTCKCLVVVAAAHALCAPHSQPQPGTRLVCGNRSTCLRPSARGTPCATGMLATAVLEGDVWCSTRPDLSIRPQPSEQQPAHIQGHARHARRLRRLPHACPPWASPSAHSDASLSTSTQRRRPHRDSIYPRSRGELERQQFLFALWILPDPTIHRRVPPPPASHTKVDVFKSRPHEPLCSSDFWFPKSLEYWLRLFLVYCNTKDNPQTEWLSDQIQKPKPLGLLVWALWWRETRKCRRGEGVGKGRECRSATVFLSVRLRPASAGRAGGWADGVMVHAFSVLTCACLMCGCAVCTCVRRACVCAVSSSRKTSSLQVWCVCARARVCGKLLRDTDAHFW